MAWKAVYDLDIRFRSYGQIKPMKDNERYIQEDDWSNINKENVFVGEILVNRDGQ
jgi:hypothetical protein